MQPGNSCAVRATITQTDSKTKKKIRMSRRPQPQTGWSTQIKKFYCIHLSSDGHIQKTSAPEGERKCNFPSIYKFMKDRLTDQPSDRRDGHKGSSGVTFPISMYVLNVRTSRSFHGFATTNQNPIRSRPGVLWKILKCKQFLRCAGSL